MAKRPIPPINPIPIIFPIKFEIPTSEFVPHKSHPPSFASGAKEHIFQVVHKPTPKKKTYSKDLFVFKKWPELMATKEHRCQTILGITACYDWPVTYYRWSEKALYFEVQYPSIGVQQTIVECIGSSMMQTAVQQYFDGGDPRQQFQDNLTTCLTKKGVKWSHDISVVIGIRTDPGPWQSHL
jgi:hypothetical protein